MSVLVPRTHSPTNEQRPSEQVCVLVCTCMSVSCHERHRCPALQQSHHPRPPGEQHPACWPEPHHISRDPRRWSSRLRGDPERQSGQLGAPQPQEPSPAPLLRGPPRRHEDRTFQNVCSSQELNECHLGSCLGLTVSNNNQN